MAQDRRQFLVTGSTFLAGIAAGLYLDSGSSPKTLVMADEAATGLNVLAQPEMTFYPDGKWPDQALATLTLFDRPGNGRQVPGARRWDFYRSGIPLKYAEYNQTPGGKFLASLVGHTKHGPEYYFHEQAERLRMLSTPCPVDLPKLYVGIPAIYVNEQRLIPAQLLLCQVDVAKNYLDGKVDGQEMGWGKDGWPRYSSTWQRGRNLIMNTRPRASDHQAIIIGMRNYDVPDTMIRPRQAPGMVGGDGVVEVVDAYRPRRLMRIK